MTEQRTFADIDAAHAWSISRILSEGEVVRPRGMETRELTGIGFTLTDPRARCIANPARRFHLPLALGELAWHFSGACDVETLAFYAPKWRTFSDDPTRIIGSCYGNKIFGSSDGDTSQWTKIVRLLAAEPSSRRAVIDLWDRTIDLGVDTRDVPCTNVIQFLVRDDALHAFVFMRSNDVIWGLAYDVFLFTMLQELLATTLDLKLGSYTHFATSLHLYDRHYELAKQIVATPAPISPRMPPMTAPNQREAFAKAERAIRTNAPDSADQINALDRYWQDMARVLAWFRDTKTNSHSPELPTAHPYKQLLAWARDARPSSRQWASRHSA